MPQKYKIQLTEEQFNKAVIPFNFVAIELLRVEKDATTKGGVYMGFLEDNVWGTEEGGDIDTHSADVASVVGRVVKLPRKLYYHHHDAQSMQWETDLELEIGDIVWFNVIESANANEITIDYTLSGIKKTKLIRIIPYQDCYVAKRGKEVICLNGYCLLDVVYHEKLSSLDVISEQQMYQDRGIVRYIGKPNKRYQGNKYNDDAEIAVGDLVFIRTGYTPFMLERRGYFASFENEKLFWCVQRRRLIFAI